MRPRETTHLLLVVEQTTHVMFGHPHVVVVNGPRTRATENKSPISIATKKREGSTYTRWRRPALPSSSGADRNISILLTPGRTHYLLHSILTELGQRSPLYRGIKIWNGLSKTIQDAPSKFTFKRLLSEMFRDRTP